MKRDLPYYFGVGGLVALGFGVCFGGCYGLRRMGLDLDQRELELERQRKTPIVLQQNVRGNEKPETYVEVNGVKYFSHIDGRDLNNELSDVVKE